MAMGELTITLELSMSVESSTVFLLQPQYILSNEQNTCVFFFNKRIFLNKIKVNKIHTIKD